MKKILKYSFLVLGLAFFGLLVYQLGWEKLLESFQKIGWWWLPIFALAIVWQLFHTLAWSQILNTFGYQVPLSKLFKLKLIAEALNMVMPTATIGGDTAKAYLLKEEVPIKDGIGGVLVDKTLDNLSKMLFNIVGLMVAVFYITLPQKWIVGCVLFLVVLFIFNTALLLFQIKGMSGVLLKITRLIPPLQRFLNKRQEQLESLDENLKDYYTKNPRSLILASCWHIIGRILGVLEIWLIMYLLGAPIGFIGAFFIASITNVVNGMFGFIPGQWGVSEEAQVLLVELLGFAKAIGLSLGIIRRIRRLFITAVGLLFFALMRDDKKEELKEMSG